MVFPTRIFTASSSLRGLRPRAISLSRSPSYVPRSSPLSIAASQPAATRGGLATPRRLLPAVAGGRVAPQTPLLPGLRRSLRVLTTDKHEKVKVLLVLYDGGKHAEEVSWTWSSFPIFVRPCLFMCIGGCPALRMLPLPNGREGFGSARAGQTDRGNHG